MKLVRATAVLAVVTLGFGGCGGGGDDASSSSNADLAGLALSSGSLSPAFDAAVTAYTATAGFLLQSVTVTPTAADSGASVTVNGAATASGSASAAIGLNEGSNTITVVVTAANGGTKTNTVTFTRQSAGSFAQQAYVKASNTEAADWFGYSVSVSGDTLAVAARQEDSNATGIGGNQADNSALTSGAVHIFR